MTSFAVACPACGVMHEAPTCPSCGVSFEISNVAATERDLAASGRDQTASDRGQTASDHDQTLSDRDQTGSDSDQRSADDDQDAADDDLEAGGSDQETHRRTSRARDRTARDRKSVSQMRDTDAQDRLDVADDRDRIADGRDRDAAERDVQAITLSLNGDADTMHDIVVRAERDRQSAALDRARASEDRTAAARDRDAATNERADAFRMRSAAAVAIQAATMDELTGVWTRKFGLEQITRELERAHRSGATLMLAFIDVDALKHTNDSEGHAAGDELLRCLGQTLRQHLRPYDVTARYGGDEFICAMPTITTKDAKARLDAIGRALESKHTFSFGLAASKPGDTLAALIARADAELLRGRR